jgi:signal transduction histidine kinase/CheY-like chemotaxis protein
MRLIVASGVLVAVATGAYAALRVFPAVSEVRVATAPIREVGDRVRDAGAWADACAALAARAVVGGDAAARESLVVRLGHFDSLEASVAAFELSDSVRMRLAEVGVTTSRLAVTWEEALALEDLGRHDDAVLRLGSARPAREQLYELAARAQAGGLGPLLAAQDHLEGLMRSLVWVFLLWVVGSVVVMAATVRLVRRRIEAPLRDLQGALGRVAEGDLAVQLAPRFDDEVGALAGQFNQMTGVLRSRAETQGQMAAASVLLADVAHAVNNPLMSVTATVEGRLAETGLAPPLRRDLEEILSQARRASRLVRGIVRFVRPGPAGAGPCDVNEVAREAVMLLGVQFAADGVSFGLDLAPELPMAGAEAQKLEHVLVALLSNAHESLLRAVAGARRVAVRTSAEGGRVRVEVRDSGPGVPPDVRERLFQPFVSTRSDGHVGLGLYSARMVAREFGGDVTLEVPADGVGALFVVSLPEARAAAREPVAAGPRTASLSGVRVLLVDDEPAVRQPLGRFLQRRGALVREAADGAEALGALEQETFGIVVADLRMPGMDGAALYRALRDRDPEAARRMVFLSGDVSNIGDLDPGAIAPSRILPKPVELAEFERFLLQHIDF